jgi:DNA polymerase-3 subunit alpha
MNGAEGVLKGYKDLFGDDFYLEIQRHETYDPEADRSAFPLQQKVIEAFRKLSEKFDVKIIATNDVHFINAEDAEAHDRLIYHSKDFDDPDRPGVFRQVP